MIVLWLASAAQALEPMCAVPFTHDAWGTYMDQADAAFAQSDMSKAHVALDSARELLPCLTEPPKATFLARYGQQRATLAFFEQDETGAVRWGLLHRFVDPTLEWPFPEDHPLRSLLAETDDPPMGHADGAWLVEKGTTVFLNGTPVLTPDARAEVPQLVQLYDKKGVVIRSYWQDGAAFAADLVGVGGVAIYAPDPEWYTGPPPVGEPMIVAKAPGDGSEVPLVQVGLEVGFPTGARLEVHPADTLRVGVRVGGTLEPLNLADGVQGTVYGGAVGGLVVAGPVGVELTAGLAYTFGGEYDAWNDAFGVGHALPLVGVAGTFDLSDHFRIAAGVRAAFGSFVWIAPEGQLVLLF